MNLDGQGVVAADQGADRDGVSKERDFVGVIDRSRGASGIGHHPSRHVRTGDFQAVEIDDCAVVTAHLESETDILAGVGDAEGSAEVGGDEAVAGWAAVDGGGHGIAVAEGCWAGDPGGVVEGGGLPGGALVGAVVEILPRAALSDERDGAAGDWRWR